MGFRAAPSIGRRPRLGQGILKCNMPTNKAIGFSPVDCSQIWTSPGGAIAGLPDCVQAAGKWTHPDCAAGPAPGGAPAAPPSLTGPEILVCPQKNGLWTVLKYPDGEFIKKDVREADFRTITDNHITYLPEEFACKDSRCAPYCGEAPVPEPTSAPPPPPAPAPAPPPAPVPGPQPIPTLPGGGIIPGLPTGPFPTVPLPSIPRPAPIRQPQIQQQPQQRTPVKVPCGAKLPVYVRALRTVTTPTSVSDWSESWMPWT